MSSNSTKIKPSTAEMQNRSQRCLESAIKQIAPTREKLMQHQVYKTIERKSDLRMELHIVTDETHHVKLAISFLKALCEDDKERWRNVVETAEAAITRRIELWDGVTAEILQKRASS
jgi:Protein of unknown function (DUF3050)